MSVKNRIAQLEFSGHIHYMFIGRLLNRRDIGKCLLAHNLKGESAMASNKSTSYSNNGIIDEIQKNIDFDPKVGPKRRDEWFQTMIGRRSKLTEVCNNNIFNFPIRNYH